MHWCYLCLSKHKVTNNFRIYIYFNYTRKIDAALAIKLLLYKSDTSNIIIFFFVVYTRFIDKTFKIIINDTLLLLEYNNNLKKIYILYKVIEGNKRNVTLCLHFQHLLH